MMIAPTLVHVREGRGSMDEFKGKGRGVMQPSQQHVAPCVKGVKWRLGPKGLRMVAAIWVSIPVEATQEAGVVSHCKRAAIGTPFSSPQTTRRETVVVFFPPPKGGSSVSPLESWNFKFSSYFEDFFFLRNISKAAESILTPPLSKKEEHPTNNYSRTVYVRSP